MKAIVQLAVTLALLGCHLATSAAAATLPEFERIELDNGTVLLLLEKHDVPLIGVEAIIRGGAVNDPEGLSGVASLLAGIFEKGAGGRDSAAFAEAVAAVGGELVATGELEAITISGEFLARDAVLMVELLADMLQRPILDAGEMTRLRDRSISFIRAAKDASLDALVPVYGHAFLFGEHPYARPVFGDEASLAKIQQRDLLDYYANQVGADRLIIAVAGDFDGGEMADLLAAAFADWRPAAAEPAMVASATPETGRRVLLVDKPGAAQTYFWLGNVGVSASYPRRAAVTIANTVFGGRFTSLLNTALRVESGLTYGARSALMQPSRPGSFAIYSSTAAESTTAAIDMALTVLEQFRGASMEDPILQSASNYILGQYPLKLETAAQLAGVVAYLEQLGLGPSYINDFAAEISAITGADITTTVNEVFPSPDDLVFVLLGDAQLIRDSVAKYGPITEIAISAPRFSP